MTTTRHPRRSVGLLIALALAVATFLGAAPSGAVPLGPAPSEVSLTAATGPYATTSLPVPSSAVGFGGGVIHHPTATAEGPFPAVVMAPGFLGSSDNYGWVGPFLASRGYVVLLMNTLTRTDLPPSRGQQALAALDHLTGPSSVSALVDADRLGVVGHSMGGGGALEAARSRPSLRAVVSLQTWHTTKSWPTVTVPTLIVGAEDDTTAPVANHAVPIYQSLPASTRAMYAELADTPHRAGTEGHPAQAAAMATWLGRWLQGDTRYEPLLCPQRPTPSALSDLRSHCPATATASGVVTGPEGPVAGATVVAYTDADAWFGSVATTTGADGSYTLAELAADTPYRLVFVPPEGSSLVMAWSGGATSRSAATPIVATPAEPRGGVDVELAAATSVTGRVTGPGGPVAGVAVWAYAPTDTWVGGVTATTDADGRYALVGLPAGPHRIRFGPPTGSGLAVEWYDDATGRTTAAPIDPAPGTTVADVDAVLFPA